jgi:hypothetical protein
MVEEQLTNKLASLSSFSLSARLCTGALCARSERDLQERACILGCLNHPPAGVGGGIGKLSEAQTILPIVTLHIPPC